MKHLEVHVLETQHDLELAIIAGLLPEDENSDFLFCDVCDSDIQVDQKPAVLLLNDELARLSCLACSSTAIYLM